MSVSRPFPWWWFVLLASPAFFACAAQPMSLSGVARDCEGNPIADVNIILNSGQDASFHRQVTTGPSGAYRFDELAAGDYTVASDLASCGPVTVVVVHVLSLSAGAEADLAFLRGSSREGNGRSASSHPSLEFQSSGIRGLIDQGGYSASTNAAAGLLSGIAQIKRTDSGLGASPAKDWPCSLESELLTAAAEHPDQEEANRRIGEFYVAHDQPAKAVPFLQRALSIDSANYFATRGLAVACLQIGEFENARKLLISFTEQHSAPEMHQLLARAYEGSGAFREAAAEYHVADRESPSEESLFGVGYELLLAGSVGDALATFQSGMKRYPPSIPLRIGAATAQYLHGRTSEALTGLLNATDIDPADPRPYLFIGSVSFGSGEQGQRVRGCFKRFLERVPDSGEANYYYAMALLGESDPDTNHIETLLKRAVLLNPDLAAAHLQLGNLYSLREDYRDAIAEYEAAIHLAPDLSDAHYRFARALKYAGESDASAREMNLFLSAKRETTARRAVDLDRFISVMNMPQRSPDQDTRCPGGSH